MAFHYLRHTTATLLFEDEFDIHDVQAIFGHSSPRTTKQVYIDVMHSLELIASTIDADDIVTGERYLNTIEKVAIAVYFAAKSVLEHMTSPLRIITTPGFLEAMR